jgi:quercetin 2,3-dioxygenase
MIERTVARVESPEVQQGMHAGHKVRPLLEPGRWTDHDPFLLLMEDWFTRGTFGDHPHRGFETVTYVLEGQVEHADNHGGHGMLQPGDVQWMTAGRGVVHSEEAGPDGAHSLQLWVNLPASKKMSEPRYQDLRRDAVPVRQENGAEIRVYPGATHLPITMIEMTLEADASVSQSLPASHNAFLYVIEGSGTFGDDRVRAQAGQVVWFSRADTDEPSNITVAASRTEPLRVILWAGPPLREPVAASGPFVMNTIGEVRQAFLDFQAGKF